MTKLAKELIIVMLTGAGTLAMLWGVFAKGTAMSTAIGTGAGLIVVATAIGFLVKPKA